MGALVGFSIKKKKDPHQGLFHTTSKSVTRQRALHCSVCTYSAGYSDRQNNENSDSRAPACHLYGGPCAPCETPNAGAARLPPASTPCERCVSGSGSATEGTEGAARGPTVDDEG